MQVDAWERGFSYSYDAPLDMRMDTRQEFSAADLVNEWPESRIAQVLRRFGEERYAGGIAREIVRRRPLQHDLRAGRRDQGRDAGLGPLRRRPSRQAHLPGDPDRRQRRARLARRGAADRLGHAADRRPLRRDLLPLARGPAASSSSSPTEPRGCVCPPELPVCVCGREPEAELLTRRAVSPGPEEVAANPRSKSAHLRVAVKIAAERRRRRPPDGRRRPAPPAPPAPRPRATAPPSAPAARAQRRAARARRAGARRAPARRRPRAAPARRPGGQLIPIAVGTADRGPPACPTRAWSCG